MAYLEIIQDGKTVRRQRVSDQRARAGVTVRLSGVDPTTVKLGQTVRAGKYELRVVEELTDSDPTAQPPTESPRTPRLDGYELHERLGEGGMGVVWKGIQQSTQRTVAVKFLGRRAFGSDRSRKRFEREVRLCAKLEHPAIVRIYDSGLWHGAYFYTMELIDGIPLDEFAAKNNLGREATLILFKTLCAAVQYAHGRGVIHRDLKPGNVLVTPDGQPHILDFGLAKSLVEEADETNHQLTMSLEGEATGTPAYMSPEQAAGRHAQTDGRTDVWSIGVMLYRLLVGHPPHDLSGTRFEMTQRIVEEEIRSPRRLGASIGADLEGLLRKALAKAPEDRYAGPGEMADDIDNFLTRRPLIARRATVFYLLGKRLARQKILVAACAVAAAVLIPLAIGFLPGGWLRARLTQTKIARLTESTVQKIYLPATQPTTSPAASPELTSADIAALASRCSTQLKAVQALDPADGISEMVWEANVLTVRGQQSADQHDLIGSSNAYQAALKLCSDAISEDGQRQARTAKAQSSTPKSSVIPPDPDSDLVRENAIEALKPLARFCGAFTLAVHDPAAEPPNGSGTALCRMRLGGTAFTMEIDEWKTDRWPEYRELIVLNHLGKGRIGGTKIVRGMGSRGLVLTLAEDEIVLRYGDHTNEMHFQADGTIRYLLRNTGGEQDILIASDGTPGWPAGDTRNLPLLGPQVDPLANVVIPTLGSGYESQVVLPLLRLDYSVRSRDWREAQETLAILQTEYSHTETFKDQAPLISAWEHLIADAQLADGSTPPNAASTQSDQSNP